MAVTFSTITINVLIAIDEINPAINPKTSTFGRNPIL
jgi:hypothetical protein